MLQRYLYLNQMLTSLTRILRYGIGKHSEYLESIMSNFKPSSQQDIIKILQTINKKKEYSTWSPISESFVNRIEYFLLKKNPNLNSNTLFIYQLIKQLNFLTPRFKYGLLKRLNQEMERIITQNLNIKNNEIEVLLWFIYREFPFMRETKFQEIASDHTLKLFQMQEYMNGLKKIPIWEPYIRANVMLQALGHQTQTRKDMSRQTLEAINYQYYPYLTSIFKTPEDCIKIRQDLGIYEPFLVNLCNKYLYKDNLKYDKYLLKVQTIDNEVQNQEIDKIVDPLSWLNFVQLFELYTKSYKMTELDTTLAYKINEVFWRMCQSQNIEVESGIKLLQIMSQNRGVLGEYEQGFILRIIQTYTNISTLEYKFLSGRAYLTLLKAVNKIQKIPQYEKNRLYAHVGKYINDIIFWEADDKAQAAEIIKISAKKEDKPQN